MKSLTSIFLFLLFCNSVSFCQSISIGFGPIFTKSKAIAPIINAKEDFSNTAYSFHYSYEHYLNKKYSVRAMYTKFKGVTFINFKPGGYLDPFGSIINATGYGGVKIYRFDLELSYILTNCKRYFLNPFGGFGIQKSKRNGWDLYEDPVDGPDYIETEPMIAETYEKTQIVPTIGMKTGWLFWKRLELNLTVKGVYGFTPYQKLTLKYKYKGVTQPDAVYVSDGTGLFVNLGIGYRFAKLIK